MNMTAMVNPPLLLPEDNPMRKAEKQIIEIYNKSE